MKNIFFVFFICLITCLSAQVPTAGLISQWPFSGNANDVVGTNNGTAINTTLTADRFGNPNCAYKFNGISSYLIMANSGLAGSGSRSISFWAKTTSSNLTAAFCYGGAPSSFAIQFWYGCSGIGFDNSAGAYIKSNPNVANGSWHHYVAVYNATVSTQMGSIDFYMDGNLLPTLGCTIGTTLSTINTTTTFPINIGKVSDNNIRYFDGDLDDFFFYNRALTPTEVLALFNDMSCSGTPAAPTAVNGNAVVCIGSTVVYSASPVPGATSYTWTLPGGWTGTSSTNTILATIGSSSGQVAVASKNCCGSSQPVTLDVNVSACTEINEINNGYFNIGIFPNPNSGNFSLDGNLNEITEIRIFNAIGQEVYSKVLEKNNKEIRTRLSEGVYLIRFYKEKTIQSTQRIVVVGE